MLPVCALAVASMAMGAGGELIIVDYFDDVTDFGGAQQVADLPGPDGFVSFREALRAADNTPGPQTIHFNIPQSQWIDYPDCATLYLEGTFALFSDEVIIDFTSQTDFTGDTNPDGNEVTIRGELGNSSGSPALSILGNHNVVKGLDFVRERGYGVDISGDFNQVLGCTIRGPLYAGVRINGQGNDPAEFNVIGGTQPGDRNTLASGNAGVRIDAPADNNVVIGNLLGGSVAGVQVRGAPCCDIFPHNNRIGGPTPEERNVIGGSGYTGEHGSANGELVSIQYAFDTIVEGNYIGTEEDGETADQQIAPVGIEVRASTDTIIRNNLVSGINGSGILLFDVTSGTQVFGNLIGTDRTGQNPLPNWFGIRVSAFTGRELPGPNQIGGMGLGEANLIAFNLNAGVFIGPLSNGQRVSGNSIHSNGGLGIDLIPWSGQQGVTQNDFQDVDTNGGNGLQNFPVLDAASSDGSSTFIQGTFNSTPNTSFSLEFYSNAQPDSLGYGEGETFVGVVPVTTDSNGDAALSLEFLVGTPSGDYLSATATNLATNATSEFSNNVEVQSGAGVTTLEGVHRRNGCASRRQSWITGRFRQLLRPHAQRIRAIVYRLTPYGDGGQRQYDRKRARLIDITIEDRIDQPSGTAQVRLRNWNTGQFEIVGSYPLGMSDAAHTFLDIDAANFVRQLGGN